MNNTRIEYNKRLHEVEVYFDTLKLLDNGICSIKCIRCRNYKRNRFGTFNDIKS